MRVELCRNATLYSLPPFVTNLTWGVSRRKFEGTLLESMFGLTYQSPPDVVGGPVECVQISSGEALDKVQGEAAGERQDYMAPRVSHFIKQCTLK